MRRCCASDVERQAHFPSVENKSMGQVQYTVPIVSQGSNPICWVACAAMILCFKTGSSVDVNALIGADPSNSSIADPDGGSWDTMKQMLNGWGFTCETQMQSPTDVWVEQHLRAYGPLMLSHATEGFPYDARFPPFTCTGLLPPDSAHAVVITGIDTDAATCAFNNPWGNTGTAPIQSVLEAIENMGQHPYAFPLSYVA
jgi:hypothetical protein